MARELEASDATAGGWDVELESLEKAYPGGRRADPVTAVHDISLSIPAGQIAAVTGASGSGKSTLLHLIGAMVSPDAGTICVAGRRVESLRGRELPRYRRSVGFVFQRFHLLPALTAIDNVVAPVVALRTTFDKRDRATRLLDAVGLEGRHTALPSDLSGGQQQRVALARALINDPRLLLADESTRPGCRSMSLLAPPHNRNTYSCRLANSAGQP